MNDTTSNTTVASCLNCSGHPHHQHHMHSYNLLPFWICLSMETLITVFGNALLCLLFITNGRLRTGQNYFVISLSVGDMVGGLTVIPCEYCRMKPDTGTCSFFCGTAISFIMTATVINLFFIACDKHFAIQKAYEYRERFTKRRALLVILFGWFMSILISLLPAFWQFNSYMSMSTKQTINLIYAGLLFCCTIVAGLFMTAVYCCIVRTVGKKLQRSRERPVPKAGVKVCIVCTFVYFTSWLQYCAVEILLQHHVHFPIELMDASYFVLMLSPCLDCLLYAYYRREFRNCLVSKWKDLRSSLRVVLRCLRRGHLQKELTPEVVRMCRLGTQPDLSHTLSNGSFPEVSFQEACMSGLVRRPDQLEVIPVNAAAEDSSLSCTGS